MRPLHKVVAVGAIAAALTVSLAGCVPSNTLAVFDRDKTDIDTLPLSGTANIFEGVDTASSRYLWEDNGTTFYAAKGSGSNAGMTCLVIFVETEGSSACSTGAVTIELRGSPAYMLADAPSESDRWMKVADNLYAEKMAFSSSS